MGDRGCKIFLLPSRLHLCSATQTVAEGCVCGLHASSRLPATVKPSVETQMSSLLLATLDRWGLNCNEVQAHTSYPSTQEAKLGISMSLRPG